MAQLTTSLQKAGTNDGSVNEQLAQHITNLDRQDTPLMGSIKTKKAMNTDYSWLTDTDAAPSATTYPEGYVFADIANDGKSRVRLENTISSYSKAVNVTDTARRINTAGIKDENTYQVMKAFRELKKNVEFSLVSNQVRVSSGTTKTAGVHAWIQNTVSAGESAADVAAVVTAGSGNGTDVSSSDGTINGNITKTVLNTALRTVFEAGQGNPTMLLVSPTQKINLSESFAGGNADIRRLTNTDTMLDTAITKVNTDFGYMLTIKPHWMFALSSGNANKAFGFAPDNFCEYVYSDFELKKIGDEADTTRSVVKSKRGFACINPQAPFSIIDVA